MSMPAAAPLQSPPYASVAASLSELAAEMQAEWEASLSGCARRPSGAGEEVDKGGDDDMVGSAVARCVRALAHAADATAAEQTTADGGRPVDVRGASAFLLLCCFDPLETPCLELDLDSKKLSRIPSPLSLKKKKKKKNRRQSPRLLRRSLPSRLSPRRFSPRPRARCRRRRPPEPRRSS